MRAVMISIFGFLVIAAIGIISICDGNSNVLCIEIERKGLLKFKHDLTDPSNRLSSWVDADQEDCCKCAGVFCNNLTGHVSELHLGSAFPSDSLDLHIRNAEWEAYENRSILRGKINPSLLDLKHLSFLDLSDNDFGETQIPEFIGSLESLTHLDHFRADFSKAIPFQLANLSKLQYLDLGHNFHSEAKNLQWVYGLSSLRYLDLSSANLSKANDWKQVTDKLPPLVELYLSDCSLSNVPSYPVSVNHTTLALLDLSLNMLSSVPAWIFSLSSLVAIDLSQNKVGGVIPNGFQNLSSLNYLDLSGNPFSSPSIPTWLPNLNHLQFLALSGTNLQGNISSVIGNLSSITHLDLSSNNIDEEVSEIIESLSRCCLDRLESLDLGWNKISGHLPDQLGQFQNLALLDLSENSISGPIPFSIGKLSSLKELYVGYNKLNGSLLQNLAQFENVEYLDISNNKLEGIVLAIHFSNLTTLIGLMASNNMLTFKPNASWIPPFHLETIEMGSWYLGPQFPQWLQFQEDLSNLNFSNAGISDVIPTWYWNLSAPFEYVNLSHNQPVGGISYLPPKLLVVDLSSNQFTGSLPQVSPNLEALLLSRNSFSGSLSNFLICNASNEVRTLVLDIGSNLLSSEIPDCWKHWYNLEFLNLENNSLTGEIPGSLGSIRSLWSLNLRKNSLFGDIPSTLQHLTRLRILDLRENQLSGSIPTWIGDKLSNLLVLNLRSNNFQSNVPERICALHSLQVLDLAFNNISGAIPKCFCNLSAITNKTLEPYRFILGISQIWFFPAESLYVKGREYEYSRTLEFLHSIDLSANSLAGEIPKELGNLKGLQSLNLSRNLLSGEIPENIGNMESLESLDLSMNQLNGEIPSSLSNLNFLSHLNLSYNNFTGQIPTGTQLQSFEEFSYMGNHLCGPPVSKNCSANGIGAQNNFTNADGSEGGSTWSKVNGLYVSIVLGFVMGFWVVVAPCFS